MEPWLQPLMEFATALHAANRASRHRRVLVLAGGREGCLRRAGILLAQLRHSQIAWIGEHPAPGLESLHTLQYQSILGGEVDALVIDAWAGLDVNTFAAGMGAVRGGGLVLLLTPPLSVWPARADPAMQRLATYPHDYRQIGGRYLQRLTQIIRSSSDVVLLESDRVMPNLPPAALPAAEIMPGSAAMAVVRTPDQGRAVAAIERCARGHRRRPVVLIADRGRGKSAALGIAAARLLRAGLVRILVTAPTLAAAETVFALARNLLPEAKASRGLITLECGVLEFVAPDELLRSQHSADLLLVDEAAAIPTGMLSQLLERYARIVFASTIHGYEGTGRGFTLRFSRVLDRHVPDWRSLWLETPIRWAAGDPAERFTSRALLLNAEPAPASVLRDASCRECHTDVLNRDALIADEHTLTELFGLLVLAHYRTTPGDLRFLLDAPGVSVWVQRYRGHVAAAALVIDEGGFPAELAHAVWLGRRRPQGHLVAQSLAAHTGLEQAPTLCCRRVLRIAVHPVCQRRGLGSQLLGSILGAASSSRIDYLAAAFGVTAELIRFWSRARLQVVRIGSHREASSGCHSAIMLRALSPPGERLANSARDRFASRLPSLLSEPLCKLEPELALLLLQQSAGTGPPAPEDWEDLLAFGFGQRQYNDALLALQRLAPYALSAPNLYSLLSHSQQLALLARVLQQRSWSEVGELLNCPGRRQVVAELRAAVRAVLLNHADAKLRLRAHQLQ